MKQKQKKKITFQYLLLKFQKNLRKVEDDFKNGGKKKVIISLLTS